MKRFVANSIVNVGLYRCQENPGRIDWAPITQRGSFGDVVVTRILWLWHSQEVLSPTSLTHRGHSRGDLIAFLGALSLFLAAIEYLFPKPLPFFRLGLANLPILISLSVLKPREVLLLVAVKVVGQGLINGTLASYVFLFSLSGSLSSGLVMLVAHRGLGRRISLVGVSILGATASNAVQMTLSVLFIFGTNAWVIAPVFMSLGIASGTAVGLFAEHFHRRSAWFARLRAHYA